MSKRSLGNIIWIQPIFLCSGLGTSEVITSSKAVAEDLGYHFAAYPSKSRYREPFRTFHSRNEPQISVPHGADPLYNHLFTLVEFRHLHLSVSAFLLNLYNQIWEEGVIPTAWSTSMIVPIPSLGRTWLKLLTSYFSHLQDYRENGGKVPSFHTL